MHQLYLNNDVTKHHFLNLLNHTSNYVYFTFYCQKVEIEG